MGQPKRKRAERLVKSLDVVSPMISVWLDAAQLHEAESVRRGAKHHGCSDLATVAGGGDHTG